VTLNLKVYGWQAWLIKRNITRTFEHILEVADMDGNETLSKEEIKVTRVGGEGR